MSNIWENSVITNKGIALQAKILSGESITITSVKTGAGSVDVVDLRSQTAVSDIKQTANVQGITSSDGTAVVHVLLTNDNLTEEYNLRQVGFYATDPDEGEILYAIAQNTEARMIPTYADMPGYSLLWNFHFSFSNDVNMTATIDPAGYVTLSVFESALSEKADSDSSGAATSAVKLKTSRNIDGMAFDGSSSITHYVMCNTLGSTAEKVVSKTGFSVSSGSVLIVYFNSTNSVAEPTLNVNNAGAKPIRLMGSLLTADNANVLKGYVALYYDGSYFNIISCMAQFDLKADRKNPEFTGTFSKGLDAGETLGEYAVALGGLYLGASGICSFASGYETNASGDYSRAEGYYTESLNHQHVQGHHNDTSKGEAGNRSGTTGTAFVIGNGTSSSKSNACRITYSGQVIGKAAYASSGADMAELREWMDGNTEGEDRRGYFVTMDGMKIKIAEPGDYICGIISANPSLIGNMDEDWMGRYVFDEYGAFVYEDYEETDPETGEVHTYTHYKMNPAYDPTKSYVQRQDRPEWDFVGLCGVIHTRDDGTCEVNGFCKCGSGGVATKSDRGYRVLERVNDHIVKVLFFLTGEIF